ncbi:hypothetical protein [Piscinibacter sp.]|uniref:hypothetical protein n=1 Tax=Piscinibacter sp. TaxID=1903157 RepID=UPI001DF2E689|nr:hypothetical protein [Piscinibacter sp.]MBK7530337.1 hypothetical protein [Piscinibacter sp.]
MTSRTLIALRIPAERCSPAASRRQRRCGSNVASVQRIGAAMELRFNARLRVQNPNDAPVSYTGASVEAGAPQRRDHRHRRQLRLAAACRRSATCSSTCR